VLGKGATAFVYFGKYALKDANGKKTKQNVAVKVISSDLLNDPHF
jgi:hypothetical protein